jgi:hypothetical protein
MKPSEWEPLIAQMINGTNAYPGESEFLLSVPDAEIEAAIASFGFEWRIDPSVPTNKVLLVQKGTGASD